MFARARGRNARVSIRRLPSDSFPEWLSSKYWSIILFPRKGWWEREGVREMERGRKGRKSSGPRARDEWKGNLHKNKLPAKVEIEYETNMYLKLKINQGCVEAVTKAWLHIATLKKQGSMFIVQLLMKIYDGNCIKTGLILSKLDMEIWTTKVKQDW